MPAYKKDKIKVGIIGASADRGWALEAHVPALAALEEFELVAISTKNRQSAMRAKEKFKVPLGFDNADALINHPDIDLIVIAVKAPDHYPLLLKAMASGKHIYCEWPLGVNREQIQEIALRSKEKNAIYAIGLQGRYSPFIKRLRELVDGGVIGKILSTTMIASGGPVFGAGINAGNQYMLDKANGATLLTIHFGHFADYLCYVLGEFCSLDGLLATQRKSVNIIETDETVSTNAPDQVAVHGILKNHATVSIHVRGGQPSVNNFMWEIHGSEGDLLVSAPKGYMHMTELDIRWVNPEQSTKIDVTSTIQQIDGLNSARPAFTIAQMYRAIAEDIFSGKQSVPSFLDAWERYQLIDAVEQSHLTGCRQFFTK